MKNVIIVSLICLTVGLCGCTNNTSNVLIPNPWVECNRDLVKAKSIAGFSFPIDLKNVKIRAMKDMIEITYPIAPDREVVIRKASETNFKTDKNGIADISGDYNNYPVMETIKLYDSVPMNLKRDNDRIYVANFSADQGLYSISCAKGLTLDELKEIYTLIAHAETKDKHFL